MGLEVGKTYSFAQEHPKEFIDDLYESIFDNFDPDVEVDLIVMVRPTEDRGDDPLAYENYTGESTVVDWLVARVDHEFLAAELEGLEPEPSDNLRAAYAWARRVHDEVGSASSFFFMHKHKENFAYPGEKDFRTVAILDAIDILEFAAPTDDHQERLFGLFAVVNRNASYVMQLPDRPSPLHIFDLDIAMSAFMARMAVKTFIAAHETIDDEIQAKMDRLLEISDVFDEVAITGFEKRHDQAAIEALIAQNRDIGMEAMHIAEDMAKVDGFTIPTFPNLDNLPPEIRELMEKITRELNATLGGKIEILGSTEGLDLTVGEPVDSSLGFEAPTIIYDEPPKRPSSIFDLPAIDDLDDEGPEVRWEN